jgi:hypothetical protein
MEGVMADLQSVVLLLMASIAPGAQGPQAKANAAAPNADFVKLDRDGDGWISRQEAEHDADIRRVFRQVDADRNARLDADEFLKARSLAQREKAGQLARDAFLTTRVKARLISTASLSSKSISVASSEGKVQLSGSVEKPEQIALAAKAAAAVPGVKSVENHLAVREREV